jgi:hypothetical protein
VVSRGSGRILELLRLDEDNHLQVVATTDVFGLVRSLLTFRLHKAETDVRVTYVTVPILAPYLLDHALIYRADDCRCWSSALTLADCPLWSSRAVTSTPCRRRRESPLRRNVLRDRHLLVYWRDCRYGKTGIRRIIPGQYVVRADSSA